MQVEDLTAGEFSIVGRHSAIRRAAWRQALRLFPADRSGSRPGSARVHAEPAVSSNRCQTRDLRRGFFVTGLLVTAGVWMLSMVLLVFIAHRISRPIQSLTGGLAQLAAGNLDVRLEADGVDEVADAMHAFNDTARQLKQSQERLVYFTRLASWQTLARKMAHEVKNSLTPIRLTMEELIARGRRRPLHRAGGADRRRRGADARAPRARLQPVRRRAARPVKAARRQRDWLRSALPCSAARIPRCSTICASTAVPPPSPTRTWSGAS